MFLLLSRNIEVAQSFLLFKVGLGAFQGKMLLIFNLLSYQQLTEVKIQTVSADPKFLRLGEVLVYIA